MCAVVKAMAGWEGEKCKALLTCLDSLGELLCLAIHAYQCRQGRKKVVDNMQTIEDVLQRWSWIKEKTTLLSMIGDHSQHNGFPSA